MTDASQFKLIIEDDEGRRSVVPVELGEVSIGRHEGNTIRLKERNVSRKHARLVRDDAGSVSVEDLDSYNGLWVNGDRIAGTRLLRDGDLLRIGDFQLELRGAGLLKADETTQRTSVGGDTQPGFQQPSDFATDARLPPPPVPRQNVPLANALFATEPTLTEPDAMLPDVTHEPTALIRQGEDDSLRRNIAELAPPYAKLVCVSTAYAGQVYELRRTENVLGRTDDNEVGIDHRSVSRQHAKITTASRRYRILDMGSANGTMVNGEIYSQIELKRGDLIELGHVKLRFVPPGEEYTFTAEEQAEVNGEGRLPRWVVWARGHLGALLAVALVGVAIALYFTYAAQNAANDKNASLAMPPLPGKAAQPNAQSGSSTSDESARLLAQAKAALPQKQWKRAESMGSAALELDPSNEEAKTVVHTADSELKAQHSFETAQQAMTESAWADAFNALQEVPKDSSYAAAAQQLLAKVKPSLASERVADCRAALKSEDWDDAELLVEELQDLDPSRHEIPDLKAAVEEGRKKHGIKPGSHPSHPKAITKQKAVPAPLTSHEPPPEDAKVLYADGTKALNGGLFAKAIELFNRCMLADKNFSMCYRAMGIAYAKSGNGPKAVRYYRLYLKVEPNARDAPQVRQLLQQYDAAAGAQGAPAGQ